MSYPIVPIEELVRNVDAIRTNPELTPAQKDTDIKEIEEHIRAIRPQRAKIVGKGSIG